MGVFPKLFFISFFGFWVAGGSILDLISALFGRPLVPLNVSKNSAAMLLEFYPFETELFCIARPRVRSEASFFAGF